MVGLYYIVIYVLFCSFHNKSVSVGFHGFVCVLLGSGRVEVKKRTKKHIMFSSITLKK